MTDFGEAKFIIGIDIVMDKEAWLISILGTVHEGDPQEIRHVGPYALEGAHGTYTLSKRRSWIRSSIGTRDRPCYPRIRELHVHVYEA
jgi:hypothetical protein